MEKIIQISPSLVFEKLSKGMHVYCFDEEADFIDLMYLVVDKVLIKTHRDDCLFFIIVKKGD